MSSVLLQPVKARLKRYLDDELAICRQYQAAFNQDIDLLAPQTFHEKIQFQKLYNRDPRMTLLCDKYLARDHVAALGYKHLLNELLEVHDDPAEIDFERLPQQFVIKCNHSWETNLLCTDKASLDIRHTRALLSRWMKSSHYERCREWCYRDVPRKIIIEKYLGSDLKDFKFFCFSGVPRYIQVDSDRFGNHLRDIYDLDWNPVDGQIGGYQTMEKPQARPPYLAEMVEAASSLSSGFNFCRVDFLGVDGRFYFGEVTFYPGAGLERIEPKSFNQELGDLVDVGDITVPANARLKLRILQALNKAGIR